MVLWKTCHVDLKVFHLSQEPRLPFDMDNGFYRGWGDWLSFDQSVQLETIPSAFSGFWVQSPKCQD